MSKGLEALKVLVMSSTTIFNTKEQIDESVKIIEKELKRLEELEKAFDSLAKDDEKAKKLLSLEIEKNRALEIVKEKPQATLWLFQHCDKEMEYEDMISLFKEDITKEQFDLLKEVLL